MKIKRVSEISSGEVLGQSILGRRGQLLLKAGARLTPNYITKIRAIGFASVFIEDADTSDILPPESIPAEQRQQIEADISEAFDAVAMLAADNRRSAGRGDKESFGATNHCSKELVAQTARTISTVAQHGEALVEQLARRDVILGLNSLKSHDNYTFQHSIDVAIVGILLARKAGWDARRVTAFGIGCLLHDIGKVFIDPAILRKTEKLTADEYQTVRAHSLLGYELIKSTAPTIGLLAPQVALQHHERQDGLGYPRGLRGLNRLGGPPSTAELRWTPVGQSAYIHDFGSLSAVADVYDALTSDRPYREGYHAARAVDAISQMSGKHLNTEAVDLLLSILPPFPVCSTVRIVTGRYAGQSGIVASLHEGDMARPVVRILEAADGTRSDPVEIDLAVERDVQIEPIGRTVRLSTGDELDGLAPGDPEQKSRVGADPSQLPPAVQEFLEQFDLEALELVS